MTGKYIINIFFDSLVQRWELEEERLNIPGYSVKGMGSVACVTLHWKQGEKNLKSLRVYKRDNNRKRFGMRQTPRSRANQSASVQWPPCHAHLRCFCCFSTLDTPGEGHHHLLFRQEEVWKAGVSCFCFKIYLTLLKIDLIKLLVSES